MKAASVAAAAAVLAGGVTAHRANHRQAHQGLFEKRGHNESEICVPGCTTIWTTITGSAGLYFPPTPTSTSVPVTTKPPATSSAAAIVPTPIPQVCPTPGTYTFPATTIVLTETTTVCGASTTEVPSGTHTLGGVTTVVETATTVVCPYATTKTEGGVVTSVIETTTYVCPSAGTYTIAPITTTVTESLATVAVPVVSTFVPGTYTAPAVVTTVTVTNTVVYCPFALSQAVPAPTVAAFTAAEVAPPAATPTTVAVVAAPSPSAAAPKKPSTAPLGVQAGNKWAMTYTPYGTVPGSGCKGPAEVMSDIKKIAAAGFTTIRVYSTDCDTLPNVGAAAEAAGVKLIIGIFIGNVGCDNASPDVAEQIAALKAWARWDLVELCVVGNEALFNGFCSVGQLKDLIEHTKAELGSAGYKGPYTTTDVVSAWVGNDVSSICGVIDVVACNAHAYFNAATPPSGAGAFVAGQLAIVEGVCGLPGYVMETGWPTQGNCIGVACPGEEQQKVALVSIKEALGEKAVFFSFTDDAWKKPGECGCEQHWGSAKVFGI
ncbi:glycoside hydrolase [Podospora appendiculata]|uniref:Probable beta-glucosidase btgE n=1 Tax=Podospora appendiculata TaxID=314037 RepID=A0AAE0XKY6_9PEZI|nr:glycoside hydrolase [Podospora appendiculata]